MRILVALPLLTLLLARSVGGSLLPAPSPPPAVQPPAQTEQSTSAVLIGLTKRIVKAAAKLGIDEAGGRILGPTVWNYGIAWSAWALSSTRTRE